VLGAFLKINKRFEENLKIIKRILVKTNKIMSKREKVSFKATEKISKPVIVKFNTKEGPVSFKATKKISKPVIVKFYAKKKK